MKRQTRITPLTLPALTLVIATMTGSLWAQDTKFTALFILNFAKYVEWPSAAATGDFVITVLGDDPVIDELKVLAGQTKIETRSVVVKKVASVDQIDNANLLYIAPDNSSSLPAVMNKFGSNNVLVVTNKKGLAKEGAGINFMMVDGKQRFEINAGSLKKAGLTAKPVLFKLGSVIS
jgi:hypothetical protein